MSTLPEDEAEEKLEMINAGNESNVSGDGKPCKRCERGPSYKHGHDIACPKSKYFGKGDEVRATKAIIEPVYETNEDGSKPCKRCVRGPSYKHGHDLTCEKSKYFGMSKDMVADAKKRTGEAIKQKTQKRKKPKTSETDASEEKGNSEEVIKQEEEQHQHLQQQIVEESMIEESKDSEKVKDETKVEDHDDAKAEVVEEAEV
jgi:hypothetical protein